MLHRIEIVRVRRGGKKADIKAVREQSGFGDLDTQLCFIGFDVQNFSSFLSI